MNVSANPPIKPPLTLDGNITGSKPVGGGRRTRPADDMPLPPVTTPKPNEPAPPAADPRGGAPVLAPDDMFNVDGLLEDWGKKDSVYDLDGSGNVDGWDLALFLGGERPKTEESSYNLQGLLDHWGREDSPYDLDGNGSVDGWDLALFQGGARPGQEGQGAPAANDPTNSAGVGAAGPGAPQASAAANDREVSDEQRFLTRFTNGVMREAGLGRQTEYSLDSMNLSNRLANVLDADGDGMVRRGDLQRTIMQQMRTAMQEENFNADKWAQEWVSRLSAPAASGSEALTSTPGIPVPTAEPKMDSQRESGLTRLSSFVSQKFEKAGFDKHPPRNLHDVISTFNLNQNDRSFMLKQLAEKYPNGLGINAVG